MYRTNLRQRLAYLASLAILLVGVFVIVPGAVNPASASTCTKYRLVAARGSGDLATKDDGLGAPGKQMKDQLLSLLSSDMSWSAVRYPAVTVTPKNWKDLGGLLNGVGAAEGVGFLGAYTDSVAKGTADTIQQVEDYHRTCPNARFILGGYSQGTQAVGDALQRMPQADRKLVAAAGFFGDPYFNPTSWSARGTFSPAYYGSLGVRGEWPSQLRGRIFSHCHDGDPVCNVRQRVHIWGDGNIYVLNPARNDFSNHTNYASEGDGTTAADEIAQALGYPLSHSPLDVAFVIDSTGSMSGAIATVKANVDQLAATLSTETSNYRFALVDYKDEAGEDSPYQARVDTGFTKDLAAFQKSVNSLVATGGGDTPESVYDGVTTAFSLPWWPAAAHAVVLVGDAPAKDPEPITHSTISTVGAASRAASAHVFAVQVGSDPSTATSFTSIASATDGAYFPSGLSTLRRSSAHGNEVASAAAVAAAPRLDSGLLGQLEAALLAAGAKANAVLGGPYAAMIGTPVALSGAESTSSAGSITAYGWDFDDDGVIDQTTVGPVTEHVYATTGTFTLKLTITTSRNATSSTSTTVDVGLANVPRKPVALSAEGGNHQVILSWKKGNGPTPLSFAVVDPAGHTTQVPADANGDPPSAVTLRGLAPGTTYHFKVTAINAAGGSPFAEFPPATTAAAVSTAGSTTSTSTITTTSTTASSAQRVLPATGTRSWRLLMLTALALIVSGYGLTRTMRRRWSPPLRIEGLTGSDGTQDTAPRRAVTRDEVRKRDRR